MMKISEIADRICDIEEFVVSVRADNGPLSNPGDFLLPNYTPIKTLGDVTVGEWISKFKSHFPGIGLTVKIVNNETNTSFSDSELLSKVRDSNVFPIKE